MTDQKPKKKHITDDVENVKLGPADICPDAARSGVNPCKKEGKSKRLVNNKGNRSVT